MPGLGAERAERDDRPLRAHAVPVRGARLNGAGARLGEVQAQRKLYDSTRAPLYYPWLVVADPFGRPDARLAVPPTGHICGAFARTDTERGVHKAPANIVVRNILDLQPTSRPGSRRSSTREAST